LAPVACVCGQANAVQTSGVARIVNRTAAIFQVKYLIFIA
jgi:hypothetical protein